MNLTQHQPQLLKVLPATIAAFRPSPNRGERFAVGLPDTIIVHFTETTSTEEAIEILCDPASAKSAHFVVSREGVVTQLVEVDTEAWHAGRSVHETRSNLNRYSLGIELVNGGRLTRCFDGKFCTSDGSVIPEAEVLWAAHANEGHGSWWHSYTKSQLTQLVDLMRFLVRQLPIRYILGHDDVAPQRKCDPGPALPLKELRRLAGL